MAATGGNGIVYIACGAIVLLFLWRIWHNLCLRNRNTPKPPVLWTRERLEKMENEVWAVREQKPNPPVLFEKKPEDMP